jgi:hypothetical protein
VKETNSLIAGVESLPDELGFNESRTWWRVLRAEDPKRFEDLVGLLKNWLAGGVVRKKFRSRNTLFAYLSGKDKERPLNPPVVNCEKTGFNQFLRQLASDEIELE